TVVGSGRMGGALGLRPAKCEPFGTGLSGAAREQPATAGGGPARTVGGVLWSPRGTRTANGRGVRPPGSGTRLEPSSADRPHLGRVYVVVENSRTDGTVPNLQLQHLPEKNRSIPSFCQLRLAAGRPKCLLNNGSSKRGSC